MIEKRKIDIEGERVFENLKVTENVRSSQDKFYWATHLGIESHNKKTIEYISNKVILEIGCSSGNHSHHYVEASDFFYGCDLSDKAIEIAKSKKMKNANFICCDAHLLPYSDNMFDCVIVNSLLHHLDLKISLAEIKRVLKKDGYLIFREPLALNPLFYLYRLLTPSARTPDEEPFSINDLKELEILFEKKEISYFGFINLISAFIRLEKLRFILTKIDKLLSKTLLKYLYWQISGVLQVKD